MKTLLLKVVMVIISTLVFYSCQTKCNHDQIADTNSSCYPNSKKPSQVITYKEMASMMNTYDNGAKKELNKYLKKVSKGKDSISTTYNWYKLDDLKQYIAYVERISKEKGIELTGFRIIPTQYPKNYKDSVYQNRTTIIFTPTTTIGDRDDVAFEPLYSEYGKPIEITKYLNLELDEIKNDSLLKSSDDDLESSSANRLKPSPPY